MPTEKTERVTVRFKPDNLKYVIIKSKEAGVSKSRWIREIALSERSQDGEKVNKFARLKELAKQVNMIGNNINQIAHHGNQHGQVDTNRLDSALEQLADLKIEILKEMKKG